MLSKTLRDAIRGGAPICGCTISGFCPEQVEILGLLGYDFAFLDSEHWPLNDRELLTMITAGDSVGMASLVRVRENSPCAIQRVMDSGAAGVIVPDVASAQLARDVIDAVKYNPLGNRGLSTVRAAGYGVTMSLAEYVRYANDKSIVVCQIESVEGIRNIDDILAVDLIDAVFIGTTDLSNSMGLTGQRDHVRVNEAVQLVLNKSRDTKKTLGTMVRDGENPQRYAEEGYGMLVASGSSFFISGARKYIHAMNTDA